MLHLLLDQIDAGWEFGGLVRKDHVSIVPLDKPKPLADRLRPARKALQENLRRQVDVKQGFKLGTPLAKALSEFGDRYDLTIVVDARAFELARVKDIEKRAVRLASMGPVRLEEALAKLLESAGAAFVLRDELVLVVPAERKD